MIVRALLNAGFPRVAWVCKDGDLPSRIMSPLQYASQLHDIPSILVVDNNARLSIGRAQAQFVFDGKPKE